MFDGTLTPPFQLQTTSPAVNSGWLGGLSFTGGIDKLGKDRVIGSAVDRGAYETSVNDLSSAIVVESTADSGSKTLRQAILDANASAGTPQKITFSLGDGPTNCGPANSIELDTPLPEITDDLIIDGYGGQATPNTAAVGFNASLCVVIADKIGDSPEVTRGLVVPPSASGVQLTVKGIDFRGFSGTGISLFGGENHVIQGNAFGIGVANTLGRGVQIGTGVDGVLIGGFAPEDRNHISGRTHAAVQTQGDSGSIIGNLIGPGRSGTADILARSEKGVVLDGDLNFVGRNTISGNTSDAILILGSENIVRNNLIGYNDGKTCPTTPCDPALGNLRGVWILGSRNEVAANEIGNSAQDGLIVSSGGNENVIRGNAIAKNGGLGIDLRANGIADDPQIADTLEDDIAANRGQNFPFIVSASGQPRPSDSPIDAEGAVSGNLRSSNGKFTIELFASAFCDSSNHGEGEEFIGSTTVTISNAGANNDAVVSFSAAVSSPTDLIGRAITATARSATGDTSEFSTCTQFVQTNAPPSMDDVMLVIPTETPANTSIALLHATDDGLPAGGTKTFVLLTEGVPFSLTTGGELFVTQDAIFANVPEYVLEVLVDDGQASIIAEVTVKPSTMFRDGFED